MSIKRKIGWQKYEDLLEQQMSSPFLESMIKKATDITEESEEPSYLDEEELEASDENVILPMSAQLLEDLAMLSNFDCWIGHTNFDITKDIKNILNSIDGVEVMRICSRYRFFIGVGKMFDFKSVRSHIEREII